MLLLDNALGVVEICSLLDTALDDMTDVAEDILLLVMITVLIDIMDDAMIEISDDERSKLVGIINGVEVSSMFDVEIVEDNVLLDVTLVNVIDDVNICSLINVVLVVIADVAEATSLLVITMVEVIDCVELKLLLGTALENVSNAAEIILVSRVVVAISVTDVNDSLLNTKFVDVMDGVERCSLFVNTLDCLVDLMDKEGVGSIFDAVLENVRDVAEVTICAKETDFVKLSLLFTTVLAEVTNANSLLIPTLYVIDGVEAFSVVPKLDRVEVR